MAQRILPIDANSFPIQALALVGTTGKISITGTSARVALPSGVGHEDVLRLASTTDCYIKFGDSTVEATTSDALFTAGVELFKVPAAATHVAAIQVSASGVMTVTELR